MAGCGQTSNRGWAALALLPLALAAACLVRAQGPGPTKALDPAAWGSDHVGKPLPEYVTGDECLFCHRKDIGPTWLATSHGRSIQEVDAASPAYVQTAARTSLVAEAKLALGGRQATRFLKSSTAYGKLDLLTLSAGAQRWDADRFADACAGCHVTAVDGKTKAFAVPGIDCYACHGDVPLEHTKDAKLVHLSKKSQTEARVVTSLCGQCHVRSGKSQSSGRPYSNQFVAGDNLFRDFRVDLSDEALGKLNPGDRHVLRNVRDVALFGNEETTCLTCHAVHKPSGKKHRLAPISDLCLDCHQGTGSKKVRKPYEVHSPTCEY